MEERGAEQQQERQGGDEHGDRSAHDPSGEPGPWTLGLRSRLDLPDRVAVKVAPEQGQERREERQRGRDGEADDDRAGDADGAQDHELEEDEAEQSEQHGQAAEEDRPSGCRDRDPHRFLDAVAISHRAFRQLFPETARDEQRVVDAEPEPEQRCEVEHEDAHGRELGHDEDGGQSDEDARPADDERDAGSDERPEHDQQREGGERERDDLAALEVPLADVLHIAVEGGAARELDRQPRRLAEPFAQDRQCVGGVVGRQVEEDDVIRGMAVRRDLAGLDQMREDADDVRRARDVAHGRRGGRLERRACLPPAHRCGTRRRGPTVASPAPARGVPWPAPIRGRHG